MSQSVLITAGAGGIGLAIAKAFVASGARVHIADVNAEAEAVHEITKQYPTMSGTVGDISKSAADGLFPASPGHVPGFRGEGAGEP